jgi:hypothetical protein
LSQVMIVFVPPTPM